MTSINEVGIYSMCAHIHMVDGLQADNVEEATAALTKGMAAIEEAKRELLIGFKNGTDTATIAKALVRLNVIYTDATNALELLNCTQPK